MRFSLSHQGLRGYFVFTLLCLMLGLALTACDTPSNPFKHNGGDWENSLVKSKNGRHGTYDIRVELVEGPARPMAKLLASSMAASLVELGVSTTLKKTDASRYVLKATATANWGDPRAPFVVLIHWVLSDKDGHETGDYTQGVQGSWFEWENGDPKIIRTVGREASKPFAKMVKEKKITPTPVELRGTGLMVKYVTGAPGDGNKTLTAAIKEALTSKDVLITEDPRQINYILEGSVIIAKPSQKKQKVLLKWKVLMLEGGELGTATQENTVPAGSLDGSWGNTANMVAAAAVAGIENILSLAEKAPAGAVRLFKAAKPPALKRIPGRALPPPQ